MNFTFNENIIKKALKANGWSTQWSEENWVHESTENRDWGGVSIESAFKQLLKEKNLI